MKNLFLLPIFMLTGVPTWAQPSSAPLLQEIRSADQKIDASQTRWQVIEIRKPIGQINVEEVIAKNAAQARQHGATKEVITQQSTSLRQTIAELKAGTEQTSILSCTRQGSMTWCEVANALPVPIGTSSSGELKSYNINYYDGKNAISVDRSVLQPNETAKDAFWLGSLNRKQQYAMPNVGIQNLPSLVGVPLFSDEDLPKFQITGETKDSAILSKTVDEPSPRIISIALSKNTWRPLVEESINRANNKVIWRRSWVECKQYSGGIWFPNEVKLEFFRSNGEVSSSRYYKLLSAKFNGDANTSQLNKPFPVGAIINDYRFAPRPGARYKIRKGGIPSDATVLDLVERREKNDVAGKRQQQLTTVRNIALPIGALLLVGGFFWWRRSRQTAT